MTADITSAVAVGRCPVDGCDRHFPDPGQHIQAEHAELIDEVAS